MSLSTVLAYVVKLWEWWIYWGQIQALVWKHHSISCPLSLILCNLGQSTMDPYGILRHQLIPITTEKTHFPANGVPVLAFFDANTLLLTLTIMEFQKMGTCQSWKGHQWQSSQSPCFIQEGTACNKVVSGLPRATYHINLQKMQS